MATSHTQGSQAAVAREDIYLANEGGMATFLDGPDSLYTILRSAAKMARTGAGKYTLNFRSSDIYRRDASAANLAKGIGAPYQVKLPGTEYEAKGDHQLRGMAVPLSRADASVLKAMADGGLTWEDMEAARGLESFAIFCEEIELLGTEPTGVGLGDGTTPFVVSDTNAGSTLGYWDADTSNPVKEVRNRILAMREYGTQCDTAYMSWTVLSALQSHPGLVAKAGGRTELGDLSAAQVAAALGLRQIYAGNPDRYGEYVTICAQAGGDYYLGAQNANTVIYGYDPTMGQEPWGVSYTTEMIAGTHQDDEQVLARARCSVVINPLGGCRISNVLT